MFGKKSLRLYLGHDHSTIVSIKCQYGDNMVYLSGIKVSFWVFLIFEIDIRFGVSNVWRRRWG